MTHGIPVARGVMAICGLAFLAACAAAPAANRDTGSDCRPVDATAPAALVTGARQSLARGCIGDAEMALRKADTLKPDDAEILRVLGEALLTNDRPTEAIVAFERSRALGGFNLTWDELLGFAYLRKGDIETAEAIFRRTLERTRQAELAGVALGWIHARQDRPTGSGVRLTPLPSGRFPSYQAWLAFQHAYRQDLEDGKRRFAALERHDGRDAVFHHLWAGLYLPRTAADAEQGCRRYAEAERLDPSYPSAAAGCGQLLALAGQFDRSTAEFDRAYRLAPEHPVVLFVHAGSLKLEGKRQMAVEKLRRAEQLAPQDPRLPAALAILLGELGDTAGAAAADSRAKVLRSTEAQGRAPGAAAR